MRCLKRGSKSEESVVGMLGNPGPGSGGLGAEQHSLSAERPAPRPPRVMPPHSMPRRPYKLSHPSARPAFAPAMKSPSQVSARAGLRRPYLMSTSLMTEALPMRCMATTVSPRAQYLESRAWSSAACSSSSVVSLSLALWVACGWVGGECWRWSEGHEGFS